MMGHPALYGAGGYLQQIRQGARAANLARPILQRQDLNPRREFALTQLARDNGSQTLSLGAFDIRIMEQLWSAIFDFWPDTAAARNAPYCRSVASHPRKQLRLIGLVHPVGVEYKPVYRFE